MAKTHNNFANMAAGILSSSKQPEPAVKAKLTSFELEQDLKLALDRVVYHLGRKGTQKSVINQALREYLERNPNAKRPTPDEEI